MFACTFASVQFATDCHTISPSSIRSNHATQQASWACPATAGEEVQEDFTYLEKTLVTRSGDTYVLTGHNLVIGSTVSVAQQ